MTLAIIAGADTGAAFGASVSNNSGNISGGLAAARGGTAIGGAVGLRRRRVVARGSHQARRSRAQVTFEHSSRLAATLS